MYNNTSIYENDEFCKKVQELMEHPQVFKDDPYFNSNANLFGKPVTTPSLKDITNITLTLPASTRTLYVNGPVSVGIQAKRGTAVNEKRFICFIYSDNYFPMCNNGESGKFKRKSANHYEIEMSCQHIWIPGNYVLLIRDTYDSSLSKMYFRLDDTLTVTFGATKDCQPCSLEDILTACMENTEPSWDTIAITPGAAQLRLYAIRSKQQKIYNEFRNGLNGKELNYDRNLLIYIHNRDWTESVLQHFQKISVWGTYFTYIDCSTLYNATLNNPYEEMNEKFCASNQIFCLTNTASLINTGGKVIVRRIIQKMHENDENNRLWICGTRQEIESLMEVHPSLGELFLRGNKLEQQPYTGFELVQMFFSEIARQNLDPTDNLKDIVSRAILTGHQQGHFSNWTQASIHRFVAEEVCPRYSERSIRDILKYDDGLPYLDIEDVDMKFFSHKGSDFEESIRELNELVGLEDVKQSIITMANQTRFFNERRLAGLPTSGNTVFHAVFTGNPGTGKTTVAKMLGNIYRSIGILSKGEVICADRTRLIGRYIGETEENMKAVLEEARGNVLFIDEAYNLYEGAADKKDYGAKVIDSLLSVLSHPNPDMVIVFAGYEKEMDAMLSSNPGLMGRFPYKYRFKDYSAEQLMDIASHLFAKDEYILTEEAKDKLMDYIRETITQSTKNFSNARWIEQFVRNGILPAMANRVAAASSKDYQHILIGDIEKGYQRFNPKATELKPKRQIGFRA